MKFKVGDRVRYTSGTYNGGRSSDNNPIYSKTGMVGTVYDFDHAQDCNIFVRWNNKQTNCYKERDLEFDIKLMFEKDDEAFML